MSVSGEISVMAVWTGPEQEAFQAVLDAFTEAEPGRRRSTTRRPATSCRRSSRQRSRAATRPTSRFFRSPASCATSSSKDALQPLDFAQDAVQRTSATRRSSSARSTARFYGFLFKAANKSTVWYNVAAFEDAGVEPPETFDDLDGRGRDDQRVRPPGLLDRRGGRLDAHRPVREHLPPPGGAGEVRPAGRATRSRGPTSRSRTP